MRQYWKHTPSAASPGWAVSSIVEMKSWNCGHLALAKYTGILLYFWCNRVWTVRPFSKLLTDARTPLRLHNCLWPANMMACLMCTFKMHVHKRLQAGTDMHIHTRAFTVALAVQASRKPRPWGVCSAEDHDRSVVNLGAVVRRWVHEQSGLAGAWRCWFIGYPCALLHGCSTFESPLAIWASGTFSGRLLLRLWGLVSNYCNPSCCTPSYCTPWAPIHSWSVVAGQDAGQVYAASTRPCCATHGASIQVTGAGGHKSAGTLQSINPGLHGHRGQQCSAQPTNQLNRVFQVGAGQRRGPPCLQGWSQPQGLSHYGCLL